MKYNFENCVSYVLNNPREKDFIGEEKFPLSGEFQGHFWLSTSGSSGQKKWVGLSKQAMLASAKAVVDIYSMESSDCWLHSLPDFHVGGLSIWARSWISGSRVVQISEKWNPISFTNEIQKNKATLTSLVPTQIYDLVQNNCIPTPSLRLVFVGGGRLDTDLRKKAVSLGWPLETTYGMTECSSQVATTFRGDKLWALPHVNLELNAENLLKIKSAALLTTYAYEKEGKLQLHDPKELGWFTTEDVVVLSKENERTTIEVVGRRGDFFKILGENVQFSTLESILETIRPKKGDIALVPVPCERKGISVFFCYSGLEKAEVLALVSRFNEQVRPFERIVAIKELKKIERSPLGKLLRAKIIDDLLLQNQ